MKLTPWLSFFLWLPLSVPAIDWNGPPFFLISRGMPLRQVLQDLGSNYSVPVIVSEAVDDFFVGTLRGKSPDLILNELASTYRLIWYEDGNALHIYKSQEVRSAVITPNYLDSERIAVYLAENDAINHTSCVVNKVDGFNAFEVFGVPACLSRVKKLVRELDEKSEVIAKNRDMIRLFPLKYAFADDTSYQYRDQTVVVPGVVTLLREMAQSQRQTSLAEKVDEDLGSGAAFSSDPRKNAVVVRDREIAMPLYERLIAQLDEKPIQVEISVSIIDVDAEDVLSLGINGEVAATVGQAGLSFEAALVHSEGGTVSAKIGDSSKFMFKIHAMQQKSQAKILSQPSVITLNNTQAILDKNVTFYTKIHGDKSTSLESITSGTLLRVTPRVIEGEAGQEVFLQINIQDGKQGSAFSESEGLPQVQKSEILTQAQLKAGEGLLLGGFVKDKAVRIRRKIPVLGSIPVLGHLFSGTQNQTQRVVRLFFIKATPLSVAGSEGALTKGLASSGLNRAIALRPSEQAQAYSGAEVLLPPECPVLCEEYIEICDIEPYELP